MFHIAICDEENSFCENLKNYLECISERFNIKFEISIWNKEDEFIEYITDKNKVDLLFLEIELGECSGIKIGKFIREQLSDFSMQIVYVSYDKSHAMQLFQTTPLDFIIKPVSKEQIENILERFLAQKTGTENKLLFKEKHKNVQIEYSYVCYFQSANHKIIINKTEGTNEFYGKLTDVERDAPDSFIRIHKSYLVNEQFVKSFFYDSVLLKNDKKLPISKTYRSNVRKLAKERNKNKKLF